jgi:hypothetical protein
MKVSDVISRVRSILNDADATGYRWTDQELIDAVNDAQGVIAIYRPDCFPVNEVIGLAAGSKQSIPAAGYRLLDVIRNMGSNGTTPGRAIRPTDRDTLDSYDPYWHTNSQKTEIKNSVYDERNPTNFWVNPPAAAGTKIEVLYAKRPTALTATTDDLTISDAYFESVVLFVLFRAYTKEADFAGNAQLASSYLSLFASILGIKLQKDVAFGMSLNRKGAESNPAAIKAGGV